VNGKKINYMDVELIHGKMAEAMKDNT